MKYKVGDKVIIKELRKQGVIDKIVGGLYYVKNLKGELCPPLYYSELKPPPEKKEKVKVGDWVEVMGGCAFPHVGQIGKLEESDIDRFKFRVRLEDGVGCYTNKVRKVEKPKEECTLIHRHNFICKDFPGEYRKKYEAPASSPVKSSEIEKLDLFPSLQNLEDSFNSIENKINELVDRLNKL